MLKREKYVLAAMKFIIKNYSHARRRLVSSVLGFFEETKRSLNLGREEDSAKKKDSMRISLNIN